MRSLLRKFWRDEQGAVVSAELVTVGTVAVLGTTVGLSTVATALNEELTDFAKAIRSLDQSYSFRGFTSCRASTAGSCFTQQPVNESILALCACAAPTTGQPARVVVPSTATVDPVAIPEETVVAPLDGQVTAPAIEASPAEATPAAEKLTN